MTSEDIKHQLINPRTTRPHQNQKDRVPSLRLTVLGLRVSLRVSLQVSL